jgi:hypothetical protein
MLHSQPIRQIAMYACDVRAAAVRHSLLYGSGPFFVLDRVPWVNERHRGRAVKTDVALALGQWGDIMLEFVGQTNSGPSVFHDLYPEEGSREGLHHVGLIVKDLAATVAEFEQAGHPVVFSALLPPSSKAVFVDTLATHGHFTELYEGTPDVVASYDLVRRAAVEFDGRDVLRSMEGLWKVGEAAAAR